VLSSFRVLASSFDRALGSDDLPKVVETVITGGRTSGNQLTVDALVATSLSQAADAMTRQFPAAGLNITDSDAEQDEAEANFSGGGISGRFRLHSLTGCDDAVTLTLSVTTS
jgi:hypothetical protein